MRSRDSVTSNSLRLVDEEKRGEREAEIVWGVGHVPSSEIGRKLRSKLPTPANR